MKKLWKMYYYSMSVWLAQLVKVPTLATVCSLTQCYIGPWFKSRDIQRDSGFHPFGVGKIEQQRLPIRCGCNVPGLALPLRV